MTGVARAAEALRTALGHDLPYLTPAEAALVLRKKNKKAIYDMAERGLLPGLRRVGRQLLISRMDLLRWLEASVPSLPEGRTGGE
jgi:excisionase family DNA binding protein